MITKLSIHGLQAQLIIGASLLIGVPSSVGADGSDNSNPKTQSDTLMLAYVDCVINWVGEYIVVQATPSELAEAAHAKCLHNFQLYQQASVRYFGSLVPKDQPREMVEQQGMSVANDVRQMTRGRVIQLIVEARAEGQ